MNKIVALTDELILNKIHLLRSKKIMLDSDLAELYDVETKSLKRQVKRNLARFPSDFMFELTKDELENLRCQIGTSSWGGTRYMPMAFTEQGVAMLSSVLNSETAIEVNIQIIRIFSRIRETLFVHQDIFLKLEKIENELSSNLKSNLKHEDEIQLIFSTLKKLLTTPKEEREKVGYKLKPKEE